MTMIDESRLTTLILRPFQHCYSGMPGLKSSLYALIWAKSSSGKSQGYEARLAESMLFASLQQ